MSSAFTMRYHTLKASGGFRFQFFCDLCDSCVETPEIKVESYETAFAEAQKYSRKVTSKNSR